MNSLSIVSYLNLGLTGLFIVLVVGLLIAALIGLKKGVFKSSFILLFMLTLILLLMICFDPLIKAIESLTIHLPFKTVTITRTDVSPNTSYIVLISNVHDTIASFIEAFYMLYNIGGSSSAAQALAMSLSTTIIKYVIFTGYMFFVVIGGNIFGEILWDAAFKFAIPKIFRNRFKGKWAGMVIYSINYILVAAMFLTPLTAIVNTVNQSYQRNKSDNGKVNEIGSFLDAYNSSVFANVFFNWTVNSDGLTFDAALMDKITTASVDGVSISIVDEIQNVSDVATTLISGITGLTGEEMGIDYSVLFSEKSISTIFNAITSSNLVTYMLPIAAQIALNSDLVQTGIDLSDLNLDDIDWSSEIDNLHHMGEDIINTGVLDGFVNEDGSVVEFNNATFADITHRLLDDNKKEDGSPSPFEHMSRIFRDMENSKLFNRSISSVLALAMSSTEGAKLQETLNIGFDQLNDISWGYECYALLDSIHTLSKASDEIIDSLFGITKEEPAPLGLKFFEEENEEGGGPGEEPAPEEKDESNPLIDTLLAFLNDEQFTYVKKAIVGDVSDKSALDASGRSIVLDKNGNRIEGRSYCLFDMSIFRSIALRYVDELFEQEFVTSNITVSDDIKEYYEETISSLREGAYIYNYKYEFSSILDIFQLVGKDEAISDAIKTQFKDFIKDGNPFTIPASAIKTLQGVISKIDDSKLLYSIATSFVQGWLNQGATYDMFMEFGLRSDVVAAGFRHDMESSTHTIFHEMSNVFNYWDDLENVYSLVKDNEGDTNKLISSLANRDLLNSIEKIVCEVLDFSFFNPTPNARDTELGVASYEKNENLYGLLDYIFGNFSELGIEINKNDIREVESDGHKWTNEFNDLGEPVVNSDGKYGEIHYVLNIIQFIAEKDYLNTLDLDMTSGDTFRKFANSGEGNYDLPGLLACVDESVLFKKVIGGFLDSTLSSSGLLDGPEVIKLSFNSVESWKEEGAKLGSLLNSLADLMEKYGGDFLSNFDLSKVDDIPLLNDVLHKLASSDIFKQRNKETGDYTYIFGKWLFDKVKSALSSFDLDGEKDLIKDPKNWDTLWGVRPGDAGVSDKYFAEYYENFATEEEKTGTNKTYYIAFRDFVSINGASEMNTILGWCDYENYTLLKEAFIDDSDTWRADNTYHALYGSDAFMNAYNDIFELDELGKLTKTLAYVMRLINMPDFNAESLSGTLVSDMLNAMNETSCLQIAIYNFYDIATSMFGNNEDASSFINLGNADIDYLISTNLGYGNYDEIRTNRAKEFNCLASLLDSFQDIKNNGVISSGSFDISSLGDSTINTLKNAVLSINRSNVFHRNGVQGNDSTFKTTVFQSVFEKLLSNEFLSDYLYLEDSPKDVALKDTYAEYLEKDWASAVKSEKTQAKVDYILDKVFMTNKDMVGLTNEEINTAYNKQETEINNVFETLSAIVGSNGHTGIISSGSNLDSINISTVSSEAINDVLTTINNSEVLYDLVPNFLHKTFSSFSISSALEGINFGDISAFYHYSYNGTVTTNYENKYEQEQIDLIAQIIDDYQELDSIISGGSLTDSTVLISSIDGGVLSNLLDDVHNSYPMHIYNQYNVDGASKLTVFEQIINLIMKQSTLSEKAFNSEKDAGFTADSKMFAQIKSLSRLENLNTTNPANYYSTWSASNGEVKALLDAIKTTINTLSLGTLEISSIDVSSITPMQVKTLLAALNRVDIASDAIPSFISTNFESMGLDNLVSYNSTSYAYYYLSRKVYGGENGLAQEGTEIDLVYQALNNLYDADRVGNKYANLSDIASLSSALDNLDGVFNFISNSHILNTNVATGIYDSMVTIAPNIQISGRGVILYNLFGGQSDSAFLRYITGTNPGEKIHALSSIFTLPNYNYLAESKGVMGMANKASQIDESTTFDPNDYNKVKEKVDVLSASMFLCYDALSGQRSYFASEIVSNILDEAILTERTRIVNDLSLTYGHADFRFGAATFNSITSNSYDGINANERNGLEGIFELLDAVLKLTSAQPVTRAELINSFTKMENSDLARIYYLSRAHKRASSSESLVLDFTQEPAISLVYGSTWGDYTSDIYADTFSFTTYGTSLGNYLGIA